ncbi:DNA recombination protein RmuC [Isoptericola sp. b441]|uniref:DNA recombination protein RmuC n=1 Tax=Actinotalea lenta TaxID=3064654 RepID=A0ABT9D7M4_9CELL|nr:MULTISPECIES: DNA recombination protein RmuC [unclassified Isoptericola]MDO8106865.1 DNA recombination protein RmuC [Isoptericola sp. b441]MDO8121425.1 DNA recombination protein RmuC [Isoptericola sp. b490]
MDVLQILGWLALGALVGVLAGWAVGTGRSAGRVRAAEVAAARACAREEAARAAWAAREQELTRDRSEDRERQAEQFRALAADALSASSDQFLALAHQRLAAAQQVHESGLREREEAVRALVEPLATTLQAVQRELGSAEIARAQGAAALAEQVRAMRESSEALRGETSRLVTALRSSHVRGRWGELQLRRLVEVAGMLPYVDFVEQDSVRTDDGVLRPDLVVRLAGGKRVVVDAKVAFLGFLEAAEATDEATRAERMSAHARQVRAHVDALAAKRYWDGVGAAPEFVVMFVPAESFWQAAVEQDPGLVEYAFDRNVVVATPSTLLALLRTVGYAWRQDALAANAQTVLDLGKELHGRIGTLGGHVTRLGRALDAAATAYNQTVASLESRVLVSARRFSALGVVDAGLDAPPYQETRVGTLSAPELLADADEAAGA